MASTTTSGRPGHRGRIERIHDHAPEVRSLFIRCVGAPIPAFAPGMFISIAIPLASEARVRPYTIASRPEAGEPFELVFNRVPGGVGSEWLFGLGVGDEFDFTGPFGAFVLDRAPSSPTIFIAEGTGIAPIRPMLYRALAADATYPVELLYFAERGEYLLYRDELDELARRYPHFRVETRVCPERLWQAAAEEVGRRWIDGDGDRSRHFYICGVGAGVIELRDQLRAAGYERRSVHYEKW